VTPGCLHLAGGGGGRTTSIGISRTGIGSDTNADSGSRGLFWLAIQQEVQFNPNVNDESVDPLSVVFLTRRSDGVHGGHGTHGNVRWP